MSATGISRYGVAYNLSGSPYRYDFADYVFCFSTAAHRDKFAEKLTSQIQWLEDSMRHRFMFNQDLDMQAAFHWYRKVESRGFCIISPDGEEWLCPENIEFHGTKVSYRS